MSDKTRYRHIWQSSRPRHQLLVTLKLYSKCANTETTMTEGATFAKCVTDTDISKMHNTLTYQSSDQPLKELNKCF